MAPRPQIWRLPEPQRLALWQVEGYDPSPEQLAAHLDPHRLKLVAGGERAGKSRFSAEELLTWVIVAERGSLFWIVGPDYDLARPEAEHLLRSLGRLGLLDADAVSQPRQGSWRITTLHGVEISTRTSADPATLAGRAPHGVLMVEAAQQTYEAMLRLRGRVAETRGPLLLSGTFEGSLGWYAETWTAWQGDNVDGGRSFSLPTWSNRALFPGGRNDPEIKALEATYPADTFQERFGALPCPPATLVFKEFAHTKHVRPCPFDKDHPVQVWVDPGWAGAYAVVAVQLDGGTVYQIDEVYAQGTTAQEIIAICQGREWWPQVRGGVIDIAGRQHQGMESHVEIWRRLGGLVMVANTVGVADGILRHRTFLKDPASGEPRLYHDPKCKRTIAEYGLYRYPEVKENRPVREEPIDRDNHAMKALAYGLVANYGFVAPARLQKVSMTIRRS